MVSETQKGAIAENLVCNWLMRCSDGRLSPYKPVADDGGIDVLVFDRKTRRTLLLQVKSRTRTEALTVKKRNPRFQIRIPTFEVGNDFYIAAILLDADLQTPEALWLIPSAVAQQQGIPSGKTKDGTATRLALPCNPSPTSKDCWSRYKSHAVEDFVNRVCGALVGPAPEQWVPRTWADSWDVEDQAGRPSSPASRRLAP